MTEDRIKKCECQVTDASEHCAQLGFAFGAGSTGVASGAPSVFTELKLEISVKTVANRFYYYVSYNTYYDTCSSAAGLHVSSMSLYSSFLMLFSDFRLPLAIKLVYLLYLSAILTGNAARSCLKRHDLLHHVILLIGSPPRAPIWQWISPWTFKPPASTNIHHSRIHESGITSRLADRKYAQGLSLALPKKVTLGAELQ